MSHRIDKIEADYINGVRDSEGRMVIRPCTEEEKAFLNKYYEEVVNTNFTHNPELKAKRKELKEIQLKLAELTNDQTLKIKSLEKEEKKLEIEIKELREKHLLYPDNEDHKKFYSDDYSSKNCILNGSKTRLNIDNHSDETYNEAYNLVSHAGDTELVNLYHNRDMQNRGIPEDER